MVEAAPISKVSNNVTHSEDVAPQAIGYGGEEKSMSFDFEDGALSGLAKDPSVSEHTTRIEQVGVVSEDEDNEDDGEVYDKVVEQAEQLLEAGKASGPGGAAGTPKAGYSSPFHSQFKDDEPSAENGANQSDSSLQHKTDDNKSSLGERFGNKGLVDTFDVLANTLDHAYEEFCRDFPSSSIFHRLVDRETEQWMSSESSGKPWKLKRPVRRF